MMSTEGDPPGRGLPETGPDHTKSNFKPACNKNAKYMCDFNLISLDFTLISLDFNLISIDFTLIHLISHDFTLISIDFI